MIELKNNMMSKTMFNLNSFFPDSTLYKRFFCLAALLKIQDERFHTAASFMREESFQNRGSDDNTPPPHNQTTMYFLPERLTWGKEYSSFLSILIYVLKC